MSWEVKSCVFLWNISINKRFNFLNHCLWIENESIKHNIASSSGKVHLLSHICVELLWLVNGAWSVQISLLIRWLFYYFWIMDSCFTRKQRFKVKIVLRICFLQTHSFCLLQMLTDGLERCGLLWFFIRLSFWRHPFTAEIHWWDTDAMLHFSKSDEETNSSTSWMAWEWAHFLAISFLLNLKVSNNSTNTSQIVIFLRWVTCMLVSVSWGCLALNSAGPALKQLALLNHKQRLVSEHTRERDWWWNMQMNATVWCTEAGLTCAARQTVCGTSAGVQGPVEFGLHLDCRSLDYEPYSENHTLKSSTRHCAHMHTVGGVW